MSIKSIILSDLYSHAPVCFKIAFLTVWYVQRVFSEIQLRTRKANVADIKGTEVLEILRNVGVTVVTVVIEAKGDTRCWSYKRHRGHRKYWR